MKKLSVQDAAFRPYGQVLTGYDFSQLLTTLRDTTPLPDDSVIYTASAPVLEVLPIMKELQNRAFGGMPIQIGYCNGSNTLLNCVEFHSNSEVIVADNDIILLVGKQQDIVDGKYNTGLIQAFTLKKGEAVELYATTLHYAPCNAVGEKGFRCIITLLRGTNTQKPDFKAMTERDRWLTAQNKWLLAHLDSNEAKEGATIGLVGENIDVING